MSIGMYVDMSIDLYKSTCSSMYIVAYLCVPKYVSRSAPIYRCIAICLDIHLYIYIYSYVNRCTRIYVFACVVC